jgi:hypothetical protein
MSKSIFSHRLQKDVILDGTDLMFYERLTGVHYRQSKDPADYIGLEALGYTDKKFHMFTGGRPPLVEYLTKYRVTPEMAYFAFDYLGDNGNRVKENSWLADSLAKADADKAQELERQGWDRDHAIIISAFPAREARLKEIIAHGLKYYAAYIESSYDVAMLARLDNRPGSHFTEVIQFLDAGFTEKELTDFGFVVPRHFSPADIRKTQARPSIIKNIFGAFSDAVYQQRFDPTVFVPTMEQLESLVAVGVKNGKQYKTLAKKRNKKISDPTLLDEIVLILSIYSMNDALELLDSTETLSMPEILAVSKFLESGRTLKEYFQVVAALDPEAEEGGRLAITPAYNALAVLKKGMSVADIAKASSEGIPLHEM